jgi:hypothetical protein
MLQRRHLSYMTAHFIEHDIDHLARMIRSRHWHGSKAWTVCYWRERIEELRRAPVASDAQRLELDALLGELEVIALKLDVRATH